MSPKKHWLGTWAAAPAPSDAGVSFNNQTIRMTPRVSIGGSSVRIRISNAYGENNLLVGGASVGIREKGPAFVAGTLCELTFGGEARVRIAAGAVAISDPVCLAVAPLADLVVSLYLPDNLLIGFGITGRYARQTNYISPPGNYCADLNMPVGKITDEWYFLCGVDVMASKDFAGIVAFGDSLTDANISTHDTYSRWPDQLSRRIVAEQVGRGIGIMNQGLGGNRILHDIRGESGLRRFDRDVITQPGVTHVIVMLGINDLRNRYGREEQEVTAAQMIVGMKQMVVRARSKAISVIVATLTPFGNETFLPNAWNPGREKHRVVFNEWVRSTDIVDGIVDFDAALRNPECPAQLLPDYDCGDGLHPSDLGYCRMGDAVDLSLFDEK